MRAISIESVYQSLFYALRTVANRAETDFACRTDAWDEKLIELAEDLDRMESSEASNLRHLAVRTADQILRLSYTPHDRHKDPIGSIFNYMDTGRGDRSEQYFMTMRKLDEQINYPKHRDKIKIDPNFYRETGDALTEAFRHISFGREGIARALRILEEYLIYVPEDTLEGDISLYDTAKMRAALSSCICEYVSEHSGEITADTKAFLMFSADFSGIQKFIYTVSSKGALRMLRSRSFILEVLMEHFVDELLEAAGVSRANLIYTGGGHCYILLPNTSAARQKVRSYVKQIQDWLIENFGTGLYLAVGMYPCSGNELMNHPVEENPYKQVFRGLSQAISRNKMQRYSKDQIQTLNRQHEKSGERECKICGTVDALDREEDLCRRCKGFRDIAPLLIKEKLHAFCATERLSGAQSFEVPGATAQKLYLHFTTDKIAMRYREHPSILRRYTKNREDTGYSTINLYIGDYVDSRFLEDLAQQAEGIRRVGVFRADVDNLGNAFISGYEQKSGKTDVPNDCRYVSLTRTASFSSNMSLFFKYHINTILGRQSENWYRLNDESTDPTRHMLIVYSGGDDIFLMGAWNDTIESAIDIRKAFGRFTCGKLTLSAGIGIFPDKYPIYQSANQTLDLEEEAKQMDGKDAVSLFTTEEYHTYHWEELTSKVIEEKFRCIQSFLSEEDQERGKAFLYRILQFLRYSDQKINVARYAYMLARLEPFDKNRKAAYQEFVKKMYQWILDATSRQQLMTAIYIYVYLVRKKKEKGASEHE